MGFSIRCCLLFHVCEKLLVLVIRESQVVRPSFFRVHIGVRLSSQWRIAALQEEQLILDIHRAVPRLGDYMRFRLPINMAYRFNATEVDAELTLMIVLTF